MQLCNGQSSHWDGQTEEKMGSLSQTGLNVPRARFEMKSILDESPEAILILDSSGQIQFHNAVCKKYFTYLKAQPLTFLGAHFEQLLPVEARPAFEAEYRNAVLSRNPKTFQ